MKDETQIVLVFVVSSLFIVLILILVILFVIAYQKRIALKKIRLDKVKKKHQMK